MDSFYALADLAGRGLAITIAAWLLGNFILGLLAEGLKNKR